MEPLLLSKNSEPQQTTELQTTSEIKTKQALTKIVRCNRNPINVARYGTTRPKSSFTSAGAHKASQWRIYETHTKAS